MTIVAGFCVREGVLICADTEHTGTGFNVYESKIILSPPMEVGRVAFAYSGNSFLAKAAIQKCIEALCSKPKESLQKTVAIAETVEEIIDQEYRKHVQPEPNPESQSVYEVMFAAWAPDGQARLFTTWQGTRHACDGYNFIGIGGYVGRLLVDPIFHARMSADHMRAIANYAVGKAKESAEGVGGPTNTILLTHAGVVHELNSVDDQSGENMLGLFSHASSSLLLSLISANDLDFRSELDRFKNMLIGIREAGNWTDERRADPRASFFAGSNFPIRKSNPRPSEYDPSRPKPIDH